MKGINREFSGREFIAEEIELIQCTAKAYPKLTRQELAGTVCELINWNQISGKPKCRQCLSLLRELEGLGQIELPELRQRSAKRKKNTAPIEKGLTSARPAGLSKSELNNEQKPKAASERAGEISECGRIELTIARTEKEKKIWREYVQSYHALGCARQFGAQIRYFIKSGGRDLGCLQFSAAAWSLAAREEWIGWTREEKKAGLQLIVNNTRFLVLPWVRVKNMASRALSQAARQIQADWLRIYCYEPVMLETFVDTANYKGTCYKASNWIYLGQTQGRGRQDRYNERLAGDKAIYVYPLQRDFREILRGRKTFKAVNPYE
jgi:hypothetical protein